MKKCKYIDFCPLVGSDWCNTHQPDAACVFALISVYNAKAFEIKKD